MKLYKITFILILASFAFGSFTTDLGVRFTQNLTEMASSVWVPGDTYIMDTTMTFYSGLGIDFHIAPIKNFDIRTVIAEFRLLEHGGTEFLIFPGIGADISYSFPFQRLQPYVTAGLTYRLFRSRPFAQYRAGTGLGYNLNERFSPYLEIQIWDKTVESELISGGGFATSSTELLGLAKIHLGTKVRL